MINSANDLKKIIFNNLYNLIDSDYVLFDVPEHRNIGDQLIWRGEKDFLKSLPYKCLKEFSIGYHRTPSLSKETTILLHGGGNFGDVWTLHQKFREQILKNYPENKIVVFPQSVQFENAFNLKESATVFNKHDNVTICARDSFSYELLKKHFFSCNILMIPDMAFCSSFDKVKRNTLTKDLILKRKDKEIAEEFNQNDYQSFDVLDWPTYNLDANEYIKKKYSGVNKRFSELILNNIKGLDNNRTFGFLPLRNREDYVRIGVNFLSAYDFVISTRLHGHILSLLLGIPSIIVDNNYGKNKRFYDTWLSNIELSFFAKDIKEAINIYEDNKTQ